MRKRSAFLTIVLIFTLLIVAACGSEDATVTQNSTNQTDSNLEEGYQLTEYTDYIERGAEIDAAIREEWNNGDYTFEEPLAIQNPYEISPLTALVLFETEQPAEITVRVPGTEEHTTLEHTYEGYDTTHQIPVLGLYSDAENVVTLTAQTEDGQTTEMELTFETDPLPEDFYNVTLQEESNPEQMEDGLTYIIPSAGELFAVDSEGEVRFYFTTWMANNFEALENGHILVNLRKIDGNAETGADDYNNLVELDLLGRPYHSHLLEIANFNGFEPFHHDTIELDNRNWLSLIHEGSGDYLEDEMIEIDKESGEIVNQFNFKDVFPAPYYEEYSNDPEAENVDWLHPNAVWQTADGEHILLSGRNQDMIMKMTYPELEVQWILTADGNWPEGEHPDEYLLEPVGDVKFPMGQHAVEEMPDQDGNPDTMDIMLFDNNRFITRGHEELDAQYSRAAQYRIDESNETVEEIWSFGEEYGPEMYAHIVSDANFLPEENNVLINYGKVMDENEDPFTVIQEVTKDDEQEVIFNLLIDKYDDEYSHRHQIYRAERHAMYPENFNFQLDLE